MKKRKKLLLILIPLCVLALCAGALGAYFAISGAGGKYPAIDRTDMMQAEVYKDAGGAVLPYRLYVPGNYSAAEVKYPLVLYLHGSGERGKDNRAQTKKNSVMQTLLAPESIAAYPCIVLAPQCPKDRGWDVEVLMGLLEHAEAAWPVDPARVYITGLSMGGYATWHLLAAYPDYFAAAVPICGGGDPETAALFKDVPIWVFHGAKDDVVPPEASREMVQALEAAGAADLRYTEYPEEKHGSWEPAYREPALFPWMFAQAKGQVDDE